MSDEANQILAMVADGKITADEAAKLIKALNHQDADPPRQIRVKKVIHGGEPGGIHTHVNQCHCVSASGDEDIQIWREHPDHG